MIDHLLQGFNPTVTKVAPNTFKTNLAAVPANVHLSGFETILVAQPLPL